MGEEVKWRPTNKHVAFKATTLTSTFCLMPWEKFFPLNNSRRTYMSGIYTYLEGCHAFAYYTHVPGKSWYNKHSELPEGKLFLVIYNKDGFSCHVR